MPDLTDQNPPVADYPEKDISYLENEIPEGSVKVEEQAPVSALRSLTGGVFGHFVAPIIAAIAFLWIIYLLPPSWLPPSHNPVQPDQAEETAPVKE